MRQCTRGDGELEAERRGEEEEKGRRQERGATQSEGR